MSLDTLLSPEEVAERLGVSRLTAVRWLRSGKLKGQKFGRKTVRMKASDLDAFMNQQPSPLTLVDATAPTYESAHVPEQPLDADTVVLAMKLRQPGESLSDVVHRALEALQAQDTQGPTPKEPVFSDQRKDILALLRNHPEGLSPVQVRQRLGSDKDLGNTMKAMARDKLLRRVRLGIYAVADEPSPALNGPHG